MGAPAEVARHHEPRHHEPRGGKSTGSSATATQKANGVAAQKLNAGFEKLSASDPCKAGDMACIDDKVAQCTAQGWQLTACAGGTKCVALPLVNKEGTSITCDTEEDAVARFEAAGVEGGITGNSADTGKDDGEDDGEDNGEDNSGKCKKKDKGGAEKGNKDDNQPEDDNEQEDDGGKEVEDDQEQDDSEDGNSGEDDNSENGDGGKEKDGGKGENASPSEKPEKNTEAPSPTEPSNAYKRQFENIKTGTFSISSATPAASGPVSSAGGPAMTPPPVSPNSLPQPSGGNVPKPEGVRTVTVFSTVTMNCGNSTPTPGLPSPKGDTSPQTGDSSENPSPPSRPLSSGNPIILPSSAPTNSPVELGGLTFSPASLPTASPAEGK